MTIKQLSVFLENKTGRINDVVRTLGKNGINMHAFSMGGKRRSWESYA